MKTINQLQVFIRDIFSGYVCVLLIPVFNVLFLLTDFSIIRNKSYFFTNMLVPSDT